MKMDCENIRELLQEYLDEALPDSAAREMRRHIESCKGCGRELKLLADLDLALRSEPMEEPPGDLAAAVRRRLVPGAAYSWRDAVMAAASIAVVLGIFWLVESFGAPALVGGEPLAGITRFLSTIEVEETALDLSLVEIDQLASESYRTARGCLAYLSTELAGRLTMILLIASAIAAIGTNAACFHRSRIRQLTAARS
ncbi:MAG: zf-HC2 domain-containing protein [Planctomycetes bacterium]|nr:zf-HC2 domain-containing protein [Planctomycetota bacterium]